MLPDQNPPAQESKTLGQVFSHLLVHDLFWAVAQAVMSQAAAISVDHAVALGKISTAVAILDALRCAIILVSQATMPVTA